MNVIFFRRLFKHLMVWSCGVFFFVVSFQFVICWITLTVSYIEPYLHLWDEAYLVMADDFSNMFLNLVYQYFIWYFCINICEWYLLVILFLSNVFVWFGYQGNCSLVKKSLRIFLLFLLCGTIWRILLLILFWTSCRILCWNHLVSTENIK